MQGKHYKVMCLINSNCNGASKKNCDRIEQILAPVCDNKGEEDHVIRSYSERSLQRACEQIARQGPDLLLVGGGDGTPVFVYTELEKIYRERDMQKPIFYFLPLGLENKLAAELRNRFGPWAYMTDKLNKSYLSDKVNKSTFEDLEKLVILLKQGAALKTKKLSLIKVDNEFETLQGEKKQETIYTFDLAHDGLTTAILEDYYGLNEGKAKTDLEDKYFLSSRKPGFGDVARVFLRTLRQPINYALGWPQDYFRAYEGTLIIDGKEHPVKQFIGLYASTIKSLAVGAKPFHKATEGLMHIRGGDIHPLHLLYRFNHIYSGIDIRYPTWIDQTATKMEFRRVKQGYMSFGGEIRPSMNAVASMDQALEFVVLQEKGF